LAGASTNATTRAVAAGLIILLVVAAVAYVFLAGDGGQETVTEQAPPPVTDELVIGAVGHKFTLDPAVAADYQSWQVLYLVMEGLVKVNPATGGAEPGLAAEWYTPDNGLTWIFVLREDAKFADGTPVTAEDVVRSVQRVLAHDTPYQWLVREFVAKVEAVNETTVKFTLKTYVVDFPLVATTPPYLVVHPDYPLIEAAPEATYGGAGPYRIVEFTQTRVVLEPNPYYYGGEPGVEKVVVQLYPASEDLAAALEAGEVDVAWWGLSPLDLGFLKDKNYHTVESEPLIVKALSLRTVGDRPTADPKVRLAIALALSQEAVAERVTGSLHEPVYSVVPNTLLGYTDAFREYAGADPEGARQILSELGYNELDKLQLTVIYSSQLYGGLDLEIASAIKDQLEATGAIRVSLVDLPPNEFYSTLRSGDFDIAIITLYPVYVDTGYYIINTMYSRANRYTGSGYFNPQVDTAVLNALGTSDYTVRESTYITIQETFLVQDIPYIPLIETKLGVAYNNDAQAIGFTLLPNLIIETP